MKIADQEVNQLLVDFAAKKAVPGGGSASALAGAMAAALVEKVAVFTVGKEKYQSVGKEFERIMVKAKKLRQELLDLAEADAEAYQAVVRTENSQKAIEKAAEVPLETARKSLTVLKIANVAVGEGNQNLRSDALCAVELATAAIYGALENVRINLSSIKNEKAKGALQDQIEMILDSAQKLAKS